MGLGWEEKVILFNLRGRYRQGWLNRAISPQACETTRDHSLKVGRAAFYVAPRFGIDPQEAYVTGVIHDGDEWFGPDFTPESDIAPEEKRRIKLASIDRLASQFPGRGDEIRKRWHECYEQSTPLGVLIKQLDKLDAAVQARVYERQGNREIFNFYADAEKNIRDQFLRQVFFGMLAHTGSDTYRHYFRLLRGKEIS